MVTGPLTASNFPIQPSQPLSYSLPVKPGTETATDTSTSTPQSEVEPALGTDPKPELKQYASLTQEQPDLSFPDFDSTTPVEMDLELGQPDVDHVYQYGVEAESDELTARQEDREKQANCGPASAAIVLNQLGISHGDLHSLREDGDAVTGKQKRDSYAIDPEQLMKMVKVNAARELREIDAQHIDLPDDAEEAMDTIQKALDDGYKVVLRTGNMDSDGKGGHYVVVNSITPPPDRQLNVSDPQNEDGASQLESLESFEQALSSRSARSKANDIMIFKDVTQPTPADPFLTVG